MLELYHHGTSVCAVKVRFALAEKGLDWTGHYVDILRGEQFSDAFLQVNPKAVVPVLRHDGMVIRESTVICEYLDEVFPERPLYPASAWQRAQVRLWTKAVDEELHPACSTLTYTVSHRHTILRNGTGSFADFLQAGASEGYASRARKWQWIQQGLDAPGVADMVKLYDSYLHAMNEALADREWLTGDALTMADVALAPYLFRLNALSMAGMWNGGRFPNLQRWYDAISRRETFNQAAVRWVPDELGKEMKQNGQLSWAQVTAILGLQAT